MNMFITALASGGNAPQADPSSMYMQILLIVGIFAVFYFILIRPQKKQEKKLRMMLDALVVGDEIITIGGIYGKVSSIKEDTVVIETGADRVKIKMARNSIKECLTSHDTK